MEKIKLTKAFLKENNITVIDVNSVYISTDVKLGKNITIYPNTFIMGNTVIADDVVIKPNCYIDNCIIGKGVTIMCSYLEDSTIGDNSTVGPYARLRSNTVIGNNVRIGNFVEMKNVVLKDGTKAAHLAYVGDAEVGEGCNIGCGAIFVNYDGKKKHKTTVENGCFIGSNCNIIAPCHIEENSYICAGTTVTDNVAKDSFVIGRVRQEVKPNYPHKYLKND